MGRLDPRDSKSSTKMAKKSSSGVKKSSSGGKKASPKSSASKGLDMNDPKIQTALLVGLLAILALALWYGFTHGCLSRRRRRRSSCR